ncbi:Ig-like domain-containing protein [Pseudomonas sp. RIT411]|uniref:Ig-like domain-containing protein n=1 Tax=Pseudomonas sp. RIT411 TaxID=2202160 RepID=UPI000D349F45|nr:Ig-like domain-containing protein [Pseudomonas sp. RIT 411]RAU36369.1 tandem-95 repeat protein [Pseudomonas sp. RIT 411]
MIRRLLIALSAGGALMSPNYGMAYPNPPTQGYHPELMSGADCSYGYFTTRSAANGYTAVLGPQDASWLVWDDWPGSKWGGDGSAIIEREGRRYFVGPYSFSQPDSGGTAYTWSICQAANVYYVRTESESQQANCPVNQPAGSVTQSRTYQLWSDGSRRNYSGWSETSRTCQAVYNSTQTEYRNLSCPATQPQGTINQRRTYEVWSDGSQRNDSGWTTTSNTCTAVYASSASETRQLACPAATPTGPWTQRRTYDVYSDGSRRNESAWTDTATCYNRTPVAGKLAITSDEDTPASGALPVTDDHSTFTYQIVSAAPAAAGTARFAGNTVVFTPTADWNGTTSMTYRAQDPSGAWSNVATVSITIRPVNDAPIAEAKTLSLDEDTQASVLLSATDIDSPAPTVFQLVAVPPAAVGQVTLAGATATFKPAKDWNGATQFTYRAQDTAGAWSAPAAVSVTVRPVNDTPALTDVSLEIRTKESVPVTTRARVMQ